jgi:hypothetical protein
MWFVKAAFLIMLQAEQFAKIGLENCDSRITVLHCNVCRQTADFTMMTLATFSWEIFTVQT